MWKENSENKTKITETENTGKSVQVAPSASVAPTTRKRGFAAMSPDKVREISSRGGKAAHAAGTAHEFTAAEAAAAGRKGGTAPHVSRGGRRHKDPSPIVPPLIEPSPDSDIDP